ncbi:MAG: hypothetical protein ABIX01_12370 [Chitinophagaceae bacterium]
MLGPGNGILNFSQTTDGATNTLSHLTINKSGSVVTLTNKLKVLVNTSVLSGNLIVPAVQAQWRLVIILSRSGNGFGPMPKRYLFTTVVAGHQIHVRQETGRLLLYFAITAVTPSVNDR